MAKTSGLGMSFFVDGHEIAGDVQTFTVRGGPAVHELTGVDVYAYVRQGGRRDGTIDATTYWNPGDLDFATPLVDTGSHYLLREVGLTDKIVTAWHTQTTDCASLIGLQGSYSPTEAADASLTSTLDVRSNGYGLEWGDQLTAGKVTRTGVGAQTSVDFTGATAFGAQAYLHVFDFDGTDATISVQSSSDNGAGDAFANVTGLVFDSITTGPQAQRKQTARDAAIERYLRVSTATTGGFTTITFAVMVVKNTTLVNF